MLVSYNWLKEYVDVEDLTPQEIADKLTLSGVEVDAVTKLDEDITNLVVGKVISCEKHPEADKLKICQVDVGEETVQIVCGAKNVAEGMFVAVARVGARLPGGMKIKRAKLRGETSEGMICSLQELGFDSKVVAKKYSEGIFAFPEEMVPGESATEVLGLNDTVLELDLTPNRSDCLSMLGVAYEIGAILNRDVIVPEPSIVPVAETTADYMSVKVDAVKDNPFYEATVIRNVRVGESPLWLQSALMAAGVRPLNNVVDVTNYVLLEYGQPLHAFDYNKFGSKEVVVRRATNDEKIQTLDGQERTLQSDHLVITNGQAPVAIAGVMGGSNSEVSNETTDVLVEAAYFDAAVVRQAQRDLGIRSDASVRYEKGVDPNRVREAGDRAVSLIQQLAGGDVLAEPAVIDELDRENKSVSITLDKINRTLGTGLTVTQVGSIFNQLKFDFEENDEAFTVSVPTRRQDIQIEADIIEEVARLFGYDHIPTTLPNIPTTQGGLTATQRKKRQVRRYLEAVGMHEAISYSLTTSAKESAFVSPEAARVSVALPMSEERSTLRTTLVPHLLDALSHNKNRNTYDVALFELGSVFTTGETTITEQPAETTKLAGAVMGLWQEHAWQGEKKAVDFFVVKGIVEGLLEKLHVTEGVVFEKAERMGMHPGRTALLTVHGEDVGYVGQIHPSTAKAWSLPETYVFDLDISKLMDIEEATMRYQAIPRYPAVARDIALVVDESISAHQLETIIRSHGGRLLVDVSLFDLYQGEHVEAGKKSVAFSLRYLDREKTLTEEEVSAAHGKVLVGLEQEAGAVLRT